MAQRYYISKIVGTGTETDPYRAKVQDHNVNHVSVIPTGADGKPLFNKCLVLVNALQHAALIADPDIDAFPSIDLDIKVNAIQSVTRLGLINRLKNNHGFATDFISNADGFRDVIRGIGQQLDPNFDEKNFEVSA